MTNTTKLKYACYTTNVTMSIVGNISPILFITFRQLYNISFSLLGLLTLIYFVTQLVVDLIFSFFSSKFNIRFAVKITPVIATAGLAIYALSPYIFPNNIYLGLVIGTFIFSASSGFAEVLISPVIAALPSDNPDREVSKLHSVYAWGVVFVILITTLYLFFVDASWTYIVLAFTIVPLVSSILFSLSSVPNLESPKDGSNIIYYLKNRSFWLCVLAIFFGGATECTMSQWASGYLEAALGIPKIIGDILGMAIFMVMLGLGRSLYSKYGKNTEKTLLIGSAGAIICYFAAAVSPFPFIGLVACALTGLCASMLWPGTLIVSSTKFPTGGVFIYAMMAAGGDFGAAIGPQAVGIITDFVSSSHFATQISESLGMTSEQLGMRTGLIIGCILASIGTIIFAKLYHSAKSNKTAR